MGVTLRSQEVCRSQKKRKKKFPEKPDFRDPDFRISVHAVAIGAKRATCSQNFRPLAAIEAEISRSLTIIKYRMKFSERFIGILYVPVLAPSTPYIRIVYMSSTFITDSLRQGP